MPTRKHYLYKLRYTLTTELIYSKNPGNTGITASLECRYSKVSGSDSLGFAISTSRSSTSGTTTTLFSLGASGAPYGLSIPSHTISNTGEWTYQIEFTDFEVLDDNTWLASLVQVKTGAGTVIYSKSNPVYYDASPFIPVTGIAGLGYGPVLTINATGGLDALGASQQAEIDAEVRGGMDFKITSSDSWTTLPVTVVDPPTTFPEPATVPKPYSLTLGRYYDATHSANLRCWIHLEQQVNNISNGAGGWLPDTTSSESWVGTIGLIDNTHPELIRHNADFEARIKRLIVPAAEGMGQLSTRDRDNYLSFNVLQPGPTTYNTVCDELPDAEGDIGLTPGTVETDYLNRDHPAICSSTRTKNYSKMHRETVSSPFQMTPWITEALTWRFPFRVAGAEDKAHALYTRLVSHRWNHYTIPPASPSVYGVAQAGWGQNHRLYKMDDDRYGRLLLGETGSRQPGITFTHPSAYASNSSASYTSASSALITAKPGGSRTLSGSQITVSAGKEVRFALSSMAGPPYLYGLLADTISVPVVSGSGLKYFLEDFQGLRVEVTPVSGVITIPAAPLPKITYQAGRRDWARGQVLGDTSPAPAEWFADIPSNGVSSALITNSRIIQSEARFDGGWSRLVVTCDSATMVLGYPVFGRTSEVRNYWLSPDDQIFGTGTRWVKLRASFDTLTTLTLNAPGMAIRIGDWLAFKRACLQGLQPTSAAMNSEVAAFNSPYEGQTYSAVIGSDPVTHPRVWFNPDNSAVLIPGWRQNQIHPHLQFSPLGDDLLRETTGATSDRVEWARPGGKLFGYNEYVKLLDDLDTLVSTDETNDGTLYISTYDSPHVYSDGPDHKLKMGDKVLSVVRPLFGFDAYTKLTTAQGIHLCRHSSGYVYGVVADGESITMMEFNTTSHAEEWVVVEGEISRAQIAASPYVGGLLLAYELDGDVLLRESFNYGRNFEEPEMIADAQAPCITVDPITGTQYAAIWRDDSYYCYAKYEDDWILRGEICDTDTLGGGLVVSPEASNALVFACVIDNDTKRFVSYNQGVNWAEMS